MRKQDVLLQKPYPGSNRRLVYDALDYNIGLSTLDLVAELPLTVSQIYRALRHLEAYGLVERTRSRANGRSLWFLVGATPDNDPTTVLPGEPL
jgi:DNA-binding MarR family transcriptional regulator